jgi:threonine synthase
VVVHRNCETRLECERCGQIYDIHCDVVNTCERCGSLLEVKYDFERAGNPDVSLILKGSNKCDSLMLWHFKELLPHPLDSDIVTLGEGGSPIRRLSKVSEMLGVKVYAKYYGTNPTGTHKDLGMSVAVSMAKELKVKTALTFSTGNAATSLAAYANLAGIRTIVLTRDEISREKLLNILALGATVVQVSGLKDPWKALNKVRKKVRVYTFTNFVNPFRAEGHKTLAYEVFAKLHEDADFVVCPLGTGGGLWGTWKGFKEMRTLGVMDNLPRMVAVQPEAVMHTVKAFKEGKETAEAFGEGRNTVVQSLADSEPFYGATRPLQALKESRGDAVSVTDQEVIASVLELGKEGYFVEPAAATALAALKREVDNGFVSKGDTVVLSLTGTGLKQPEAIEETVRNGIVKMGMEDLDRLFKIIVGDPT